MCIRDRGFELVDVEFAKDGQAWNLNVYIDKPGGVDLDDCEAASRLLDPLFDADPRIAGRHDYLSVSSPGLDRPLKTDRDFARALNTEIEIRLFAPVDKQKRFTGVLEAFDEDRDAPVETFQVGLSDMDCRLDASYHIPVVSALVRCV